MRIFVRQLRVDAAIGARLDERDRRQPVVIDIEAEVSPPIADTIDHTVDYVGLAAAAQAIAEGPHITLVECFAAEIADACLALGVRTVEVTVTKPQALAPAMVGAFIRKGGTDDRAAD